MAEMSRRAVARTAFAAAGLNLAAAIAMLLLLRPGLPGAPGGPARQIAYLQGQTATWWTGWLVWHAAAIGLLAFYVGLAGLWRRRAPIRCDLALVCAGAGLAADLSAEAIYMGLAPGLGPDGFAIVEAGAGLLTGYVGNGLYTLAGLLLVWAGAGELPRGLLLLSLPVWVAGFSLSAATLGQSAAGQFWSTALLMPMFVLWAGLVGRWLHARAS